jgi:hypothetical protein
MDENVISILRHVEKVRPWLPELSEAVARIKNATNLLPRSASERKTRALRVTAS